MGGSVREKLCPQARPWESAPLQVGQQIEVRLDAAQQKGAAMAQGEPWPLPQQQLSKLKVIFGSQVHRPLSMLAPVAPCSFQYGQEEGKK